MNDPIHKRGALRPNGLWGLSLRFWSVFIVGAAFIMFDAFATIIFLAIGPIALSGQPGQVRVPIEATPISSALIAISPSLFVIQRVAAVLLSGWTNGSQNP
jgi:hypothetical protein